ncbi:MAG: hypothetical protein LBU79_02545 [Planctomycetota bacterium]|jgi:hypothetical protein|nr:hypothetical protein [Planctomycetota bacterium]
MIFYNEDKSMSFSFTDFECVVAYDITANKFDGAAIVDFVATSNKRVLFIEAKNYIRTSNNTCIQASIDKTLSESIDELRDEVGFARKMIKKLEHSLFVWIASGNHIQTPIFLLLVFNPPQGYLSRERTKLVERLRKYLPSGAKDRSLIFFDFPSLTEIQNRYGFSVTIQ